jgi:hypothetical protein
VTPGLQTPSQDVTSLRVGPTVETATRTAVVGYSVPEVHQVQTAFRLVQTGIGTVRMMLVPRPAAVWISNFALICAARARIFRNPKPSLFSRLLLEIPDPLSFTLRMRSGGFQRSVTFINVGWACRTALLIASWAKRSSSCWIPGGKISSGTTSNWRTQRNRPATFECSTKRCNVVVKPDSSIALEPKLLVAPRQLRAATRCR